MKMKLVVEPNFRHGAFVVDCPRLDVCGDHCNVCDGYGEIPVYIGDLATLVHNITVAAALELAFRAGDNFGFHMGSDETQCTCQWAPNARGEAYKGFTRCEQEEADEYFARKYEDEFLSDEDF